MKTTGLGVLFMLVASLSIAEVNIDTQIEALKTATAQERVELMNEFKTTLSTLSQEERAAAIEKFISNTETDSQQLKTRERARERVQVKQMDETMQRQESQRMNQNQVGSQFIQQNPNTAPDAGGTPNKFMKR